MIAAALDRSTLVSARTALGLLGLACVLPFLSPVFRAPIASFYGEAVAFALGLAAIAVMLAPSLWPGMRMPRIALVFVGFAMLMVLQIALGKSVYPQLNLLGALYVLWAAALAMLANRLAQVLGTTAFVAVLAWCLLAGSVISALIGLIQSLGVQTPLAPFMLPQVHGRVYANTGQPNHLASYLCVGLASAGYLWATRRLGTLAASSASVLLCAVLAMSGSRAVWLYAAAFTVLAAIMVMRRPGGEEKRLLLFGIAVAGGLFAAQWSMSALMPQHGIPMESIGARVQAEGLSSPIRMRFWGEALAMFRAAPLLGVGFKQFAWNNFLLTASIPAAVPDEGIIDHAHNLIFQIAAEFGLAGLTVLLGGLVWWGRAVKGAQIDPALWWMGAVLAVLGLHSMLEYPLWYAYFLGLAAIVMGAAEHDAPKANAKPGGRIFLCAAVLLGAFAFANVYRDYRVMQSLQRMAIRESSSASVSGDDSVQVLLDLQRTSLFGPFIEFALARRMTLNTDHLQDKIVLNARAMRFQPSNDFAYRQALLLAMAGDFGGMQAQWNLAVANFPNDREAALNVVRGLEKSGGSGMKELLDYAQQQDRKAEK